MTDRRIRAAVADGALVRLRIGSFCLPHTDPALIEAGSVRGLLTCVSELRRRGVFVLGRTHLHIHIASEAARLPPACGRHRINRDHLRRTPHPSALAVEPVDALVHAMRCQTPRAALATLDSALHLGVVTLEAVDEVFDALPRRFRRLRSLLDPRAESGPETLMRLILRSLGCTFEVQVPIDTVGRVDFLVNGWLIVECDSEAHHSDWAQQKADRRRDQNAAVLGYATYRPIAEDIMWRQDLVRAALSGLLGVRAR